MQAGEVPASEAEGSRGLSTPRGNAREDERHARSAAKARMRRSRAAVACSICRTRKTRCDNTRPSCGYCLLHGLQCRYPDTDSLANELGDPIASNAAILEGVNRAVSLLEDLKKTQEENRGLHLGDYQSSSPLSHRQRQTASIADAPSPRQVENTAIEVAPESAFTDDGFGQLEIPQSSARTSACESVLRWPSLASFGHDRNAMSFALEATATDDNQVMKPSQGRLEEDRIFQLCTRFLRLIHVKNPILNVSEFKRHAHNTAAMGFGWDAAGCLVLLACALACVAVPYDQIVATEQMGKKEYNPGNDVDIATAEAFYNAAQRRLGLLPNSLIAVQCSYLAGLYEKFLIRPVAAWTLLQGACVKFQALLYAKGLAEATGQASRSDSRARHVEQRLYWSCVKAECELRAELQLPSSQLLQFKYPDPFPSLSFPTVSDIHHQMNSPGMTSSPFAQAQTQPWTSPSTVGVNEETSNHPTSSLQPEEEQSWLHYLAEISLRGIMNRVLSDLYSKGEESWLSLSPSMIRRSAAYIEELQQWHAHLPPQLSFVEPMEHRRQYPDVTQPLPSSELAFFLLTRYVGVLEWIHRPFLYAYLHGHGPGFYSAGQQNVLEASTATSHLSIMAGNALHAADILIMIVGVHHRHGGIWGLVRRAWGASLLLIATATRHRQWQLEHGAGVTNSLVGLPSNYHRQVDKAKHLCKIWAGTGAADLDRMARTLDILSPSRN